jgi:hypothetical protein
VNVNWAEAGLRLMAGDWCRRLIFSWPGCAGSLSALAMAFEMMPVLSPFAHCQSCTLMPGFHPHILVPAAHCPERVLMVRPAQLLVESYSGRS